MILFPLPLLGIEQPFAGHLEGKPQHVIDMFHGRTMSRPDKRKHLRLEPTSNNKSLLDLKSVKQKEMKAQSEKTCPEKGVWTNFFGTFKSDDGTKYVGDWKDDQSHGQGTETYTNGDRYVGNWKEGKYHGFGVKTYADGRVEEGQWENNELTDVNSKFDELISSTNLLSVHYFDGNNLLIDRKSEQISETTKLPSTSMAKSLTSSLLGHAICKGKINSIEDPVQKYWEATSEPPYGNKTLRQMVNMTAGDGNLFDRSADANVKTFRKIRQGELSRGQTAALADYGKWDFLPNYDVLMIMGTTTVMHSIDKAKGIKETSALEYNYSSLDADIVLNVIGIATMGDPRDSVSFKFLQKNLAERAGTTDELIWEKDGDGSLVGGSFFYATRKDYLRLGIMIANDWKSDTCIGKYLRDIEKNKISKGYGKGSYGGFFHFDRNASMQGHGGQRIIINWNTGSVLVLLAKTDDYDFKDNFESISPE